ncbi:MAG TPA: LysM peptidoglycan-binding domain-containing protein [Streptosporangiaceae bacterium]|nr:LysM peptidoglycan-binding domain-containing protein [Streptosporangiaceae bacterium]
MTAPARVTAPARTRVTAQAGGRPVRGGQARRNIRLTRRGRIVVWALAALAVAAVLTPVLLMVATGAQAANHGLPPAAVHQGLRHVVVQPGQTLWSIASAAEPTADPRLVIQQIMQVNALSGGIVVPGESLWVPAG